MRKLLTFASLLLVAVVAVIFAGCGSNNSTPAGLSVTTASLPAGTVGVAYSQTLGASGGTAPYTWSVTSGALPAGLALDGTTGVISGTPTSAATSAFTVTVTDAASPQGTASAALSITINAMTITTTTLPGATVGSAYSQTLAVSGGVSTYAWSVTAGTLPAGLTLAGATGIISGTPTTAGTSSFTVSVTDSGAPTNTASQALSIVVSAAGSPLAITTTTVPAATFATAYSQTLVATGGTTPYTWTLSAGTLPRGVTLSSAGVLSGTPLANGPFSITVRVTDAASATTTQALSLTVNISATILSGKTIYDAQCAGCHGAGIYDTSIANFDLGLTTLANINARFSGGASHNGQTMSATQITDMFNFLSLF